MAHVTATERIELPRPIKKALRRVDRRLRRQALLKGLGTAALIAAVGAAAGMLADLAFGLPQAARWGIGGAWVFALALPLLIGLAKAFGRGAHDLALAGVLEQADGTLGDRLTGAVDLLKGRTHGSPALIEALAHDAAARVSAVDPAHRTVGKGVEAAGAGSPRRGGRRRAGGLERRPVRHARAAVPRASRDSDRVGLFVVTVVPGDVVVAKGDDVKISAHVMPRFTLPAASADPGAAWLELMDADSGKPRRVAMDTNAEKVNGSFSVALPKVANTLTYRVVTRSGESRKHTITAVDPPTVATVAARVEPPSYTKFPAVEARNAARIEALEDSRVHLMIATAAPVHSVQVAWPARASADESKIETRTVAATVGRDGKSATIALPAEASGTYEIMLRDQHGLKNRPAPPRRVVVRPDAPPTIAVRVPGGDETKEARGDDVLRLGLAAHDDVAVASVALHYKIEHATGSAEKTDEGHQEANVRGIGTAVARGETTLALKPLGLKPGDVVAWRVRVADNRPAPKGPNVVWSSERRLTVVAKADPLSARQGQAGRESVQAELNALKKAAAENRQATELLRYAADAARNGNGTFDRDKAQELTRREAAAREMVENLHAFSRRLEEDAAFHPLARPARQAADVEAEAARVTLDQARQDEDPGKRFADLRQADTRLGAVSMRLEEIQRDMNALIEREADVRRLQGLADRQAEVAAHAGPDEKNAPADAAPPDRLRLDKLAAEQNAVRNELDALLKKSPDLRRTSWRPKSRRPRNSPSARIRSPSNSAKRHAAPRI